MRAPKQAPDQGRHTMKDPTGGDLTQPGDALLPFQPQVQDLAGRFPKRDHGVRGQVTAFSVVPPRTASRIEGPSMFKASTENNRPSQLCSAVATVTFAFT